MTAALAALCLSVSAGAASAAGTGLIFVSNEKSHEVVVLDASYQIVKRIETSRRPRDMPIDWAASVWPWSIEMMPARMISAL